MKFIYILLKVERKKKIKTATGKKIFINVWAQWKKENDILHY